MATQAAVAKTIPAVQSEEWTEGQCKFALRMLQESPQTIALISIKFEKEFMRLGVVQSPEDIFYIALEKAATNFGQFRGESKELTWLTTIAFNEALMLIRHAKRFPHYSTEQSSHDSDGMVYCVSREPVINPDYDEAILFNQRRAILRNFLNTYRRKHCHEIIDLTAAGHTSKQIGRILGVTPEGVKSCRKRFCDDFRGFLKK
jgi:RNA polymerase sigma factor (sigma-70 family)